MSRSYHQTKKSAARDFSEGDLQTLKEYSLKTDVKKWSKKYRKIYQLVKEGRPVDKIRNSVVVRAIKIAKSWRRNRRRLTGR